MTDRGPPLLRRIGQARYGERWLSQLARDMGVSLRTMQRWAAGEWPIPPRIWPHAARLLRGSAAETEALLEILSDAVQK